MPEYLNTPITNIRETDVPRYGIAADGYTARSGAPTCWMVTLEGERRERRIMFWQFSNAGTLFVRVNGQPRIIEDLVIQEALAAA